MTCSDHSGFPSLGGQVGTAASLAVHLLARHRLWGRVQGLWPETCLLAWNSSVASPGPQSCPRFHVEK